MGERINQFATGFADWLEQGNEKGYSVILLLVGFAVGMAAVML